MEIFPQSIFYFATCAMTEADAAGLVSGARSDLALSEEGMAQARSMAKVFSRNPFKIRQMVCSPMLRTVQTADFIHDVMSVKLRTAALIKARDFGKWESERWSKVHEIVREAAFDPPGGESRAAFEARVNEGISKILEGPAPVLIVSHPEVGEVLFRRITGESTKLGTAEAFRIRADAAARRWSIERL